VIVILILNIPFTALVVSLDKSMLGVAPGDYFNIEVLENPLDSMPEKRSGDFTKPEGFTRPEDFTKPEEGLFIANLELEDFLLFPEIERLPSTGTVFTIKIFSTPNGSKNGELDITIRGSTTRYETDFSYGSSVVFTDWNSWINILNNYETNAMLSNDEIESFSVEVTTNDEMFFQTQIVVNMAIPDEKQEFISERQIIQHVRYDKSTGIQDLILVEIKTTSSFKGEIVQFFQMEFTTKAATPPDYSSIFLVGLGAIMAIGIGAFVINRKRYQSQDLERDSVDFQRETMKKEKSQLQSIQEKLAEIEKREKESLNKAEEALKTGKVIRRRRR
jgi:hypothetical protein